MTDLSARNLAKYGLRRGAYDGATERRFVLFESGTDPATGKAVEWRMEFNTKRERDEAARAKLDTKRRGV